MKEVESQYITTRLPKDLVQRLRAAAVKAEQSYQDWIGDAIRAKLNKKQSAQNETH